MRILDNADMKWGAWLWGGACVAVVVGSAAGWLLWMPPVLLSVPAGLFSVGAGSFCIGRPGLLTPGRVLACLFAALLAVVAATHLPLRAGFTASRNALNLAADEARSRTFVPGHRAGLYPLDGAEIAGDGSVWLWTKSMPYGRCGFVRSKTTGVPGAMREVVLGDGWSYVFVRHHRP